MAPVAPPPEARLVVQILLVPAKTPIVLAQNVPATARRLAPKKELLAHFINAAPPILAPGLVLMLNVLEADQPAAPASPANTFPAIQLRFA